MSQSCPFRRAALRSGLSPLNMWPAGLWLSMLFTFKSARTSGKAGLWKQISQWICRDLGLPEVLGIQDSGIFTEQGIWHSELQGNFVSCDSLCELEPQSFLQAENGIIVWCSVLATLSLFVRRKAGYMWMNYWLIDWIDWMDGASVPCDWQAVEASEYF